MTEGQNSILRGLRQLRADGGPLGPYGSGHFTYEESVALLTIAEEARELMGQLRYFTGTTLVNIRTALELFPRDDHE